MEWVNAILTVLFIVVALLMIFFILLQEGKGGGLAALGGTKAAGVEGVTNPIRRATAYLAGIFFFLAILLGWLHRPAPGTKFTTMSGSAAGTPAKTLTAPESSSSGPADKGPAATDTPPANNTDESGKTEASKTVEVPLTKDDAVKPLVPEIVKSPTGEVKSDPDAVESNETKIPAPANAAGNPAIPDDHKVPDPANKSEAK